jgi:hypothetical protein
MSILDRKFLLDLYVKPPKLSNYNDFISYLKQNSNIILLDAKHLFSHFEGEGSDREFMGLYEHNSRYIIIQIYCGTCSGCVNKNNSNESFYNELIDVNISRAYVTTNLDEALTYYKQKSIAIQTDTDFYYTEPLFEHIN